jgi:DNA-binding CsgD family transcriptional regulator
MLPLIFEKILKDSVSTNDDFDYDALSNEPIHIYTKDSKGAYLAANKTQAVSAGLQSAKDFIGIKDNDLCWQQFATNYQQRDKRVMYENKTIHCLEPGITVNKQYIKCLSIKTPLRSKMGKAIGIMGITYFEPTIQPMAGNTGLLSNQQVKCLDYLCKGKTTKQIAAIMQLSPRTVEHYITAIKNKMNCNSREELIKQAYDSGFFASFIC